MKKTECKDKTRNNRFAEAIDELKRNHGVSSQLELAKKMGVDKNTISNIINCRTYVTEDMITKLQTVSGCIFNLQWLRGESDVMFAKAVENGMEQTGKSNLDMSSMINALLASKDETIAEKDKRLEEKDALIAEKDKRLEELEDHIKTLKQEMTYIQGSKNTAVSSVEGYPFPTGVADDP